MLIVHVIRVANGFVSLDVGFILAQLASESQVRSAIKHLIEKKPSAGAKSIITYLSAKSKAGG